MAKETTPITLTPEEKSVIKALINAGSRTQDINALINSGRDATVNFGRIANVKKSTKITPATESEVRLFRAKKQKFDHTTGLCAFNDERLVRAREAMILAVELFNTPRIMFKAGVFVMLSQVAWTYLLHEHYTRKKVAIEDADGFSLSLSKMLERTDCPLSQLAKKNLLALKQIRDVVEHHLIGPFDKKWVPFFQASCLNFEKYIVELFGPNTSLGSDLGFVLQFAKLSTEDISGLQSYDLPEHISALDANLANNLSDGESDSLEYAFKVVYTLQATSKSKAHFKFIQPNSAEGIEVHNVLTKYKTKDEMYPHKPTKVVTLVNDRVSTRDFTSDKHTRAWKFFKIRPKSNAAKPAETDEAYCVYHEAHADYTYSDEWVEKLVTSIQDDDIWAKIRKQR